MWRSRVVRESCNTHGGAYVQVQSFFLAESARAERVAQPASYVPGGVFPSLRQQNHELVSAIAKSVNNHPKLRFDQIPDFRQQLASDQVPVRVIHLLEVVQINEQYRELVAEA